MSSLTTSFNYEPRTRDRHIALLGDSVFDNKIYVPNGLSVHGHLTSMLTELDRATLVAVDGAVVS